VDPLDLVPIVPPGREPRERDRGEDLAAAIVVFGLPLVYLLVLTFTDLTKQPSPAVLWLPAGISVLGAAICVAARVSLGRSIVTVVGCLWWCLVAAVAMVAIDILIFPF
jgi:hypothetical protein